MIVQLKDHFSYRETLEKEIYNDYTSGSGKKKLMSLDVATS